MFTGIIQSIGTVKHIERDKDLVRCTIYAPDIAAEQQLGSSVAVDGTCYTVTAFDKETFTFEAMPETQKRTILGLYKKGTTVNLEIPLKLGDRLHGHFVQGHVDTIAEVLEITTTGESKTLRISLPPSIKKFVAYKGSIAVNGVSLTVSAVYEDSFEVALIPETLLRTNLGIIHVEAWVNLEVDLLARYILQSRYEVQK